MGYFPFMGTPFGCEEIERVLSSADVLVVRLEGPDCAQKVPATHRDQEKFRRSIERAFHAERKIDLTGFYYVQSANKKHWATIQVLSRSCFVETWKNMYPEPEEGEVGYREWVESQVRDGDVSMVQVASSSSRFFKKIKNILKAT